MRLRISRTAKEQLDALDDDDLWFEAWNELRRLQRSEVELQCEAGHFANHWCPSARIGFRVSRQPRILL
jgi:hypothetical protein